MSINKRIEFLIANLAKGNKRVFAKSIDVPPTTISGIVGSRGSDPSYSTLKKIINTYPEISLTWLLNGEGEPFNRTVNQTETNRHDEVNSPDKESLEKISNSIFLSGNLKLLRKHIHQTQDSFAAIFGVNRNNIVSYERGSKPKLHFLLKIVNYFNISLDKLISFDLKKHPEILEKVTVQDKKEKKTRE
ncbi:MAG: helix-turn-helix transcriptional regulator [Prolixibacteraceae bacterium]